MRACQPKRREEKSERERESEKESERERVRERETPGPLAPRFMIFLLPWACPV